MMAKRGGMAEGERKEGVVVVRRWNDARYYVDPHRRWWIIKRRVENGIKSDKRPPTGEYKYHGWRNNYQGGRQPFFSGE